MRKPIVIGVLALLAFVAGAMAQNAKPSNHVLLTPKELKWGPPPPVFQQNAKFTVLAGDPSQPGLYAVRLKLPAGYKIMPHFHPTDEHITVMSGKFMVGMGDSIDTTQATVLMTGGQITAHANQHHYAVARGLTLVQVEAMGPFKLTYVDPKNDPRNAPKTK